jgi:hypothetical protein
MRCHGRVPGSCTTSVRLCREKLTLPSMTVLCVPPFPAGSVVTIWKSAEPAASVRASAAPTSVRGLATPDPRAVRTVMTTAARADRPVLAPRPYLRPPAFTPVSFAPAVSCRQSRAGNLVPAISCPQSRAPEGSAAPCTTALAWLAAGPANDLTSTCAGWARSQLAPAAGQYLMTLEGETT